MGTAASRTPPTGACGGHLLAGATSLVYDARSDTDNDSGQSDGKGTDVNTNKEATRLVGGRIDLRDWRAADLDRWAAWMAPGHRWKSLDGPYYALPTPDEIEAMVERRRVAIAEETWPTPRVSLVIADKETDDLIGLVTWYWESEETAWPGVGIVIFDPAHWRGGRGYEALGL